MCMYNNDCSIRNRLHTLNFNGKSTFLFRQAFKCHLYANIVEVHPKLLISQGKFFGPKKFTLRYHQCERKGDEM